jgi:glycosyltransferase involved in cell wall biosynthesis
MKVMELCLSASWGGLELYMARTVEALAKSHQVLAVIGPRRSAIKEFLDDLSYPYLHCRVVFSVFPLFAAWRLARMLDAEQVDVLHVHWRKDVPLASLGKRLSRRKPRLVYTRQMKISHSKNDIYHNFIYSQFDRLITITRQLQEDVQRKLHDKFKHKIKLLYYGTRPPTMLDAKGCKNLKHKHKIGADQFVIGLVGKMMEGKGQHLLVEALSMMKENGMNCTALLVGHFEDAKYVARVQTLAQQLNLNDNLILLRHVKNPQELMQLCDVVVLTSRRETFGLVLIEAMSVGKAVVGSDAGGVPEIIDHGTNGFLFESENSRSLYEQLATLYRDPVKTRKFGEAGRRKAERMFSLDSHYRELQQLMQ